MPWFSWDVRSSFKTGHQITQVGDVLQRSATQGLRYAVSLCCSISQGIYPLHGCRQGAPQRHLDVHVVPPLAVQLNVPPKVRTMRHLAEAHVMLQWQTASHRPDLIFTGCIWHEHSVVVCCKFVLVRSCLRMVFLVCLPKLHGWPPQALGNLSEWTADGAVSIHAARKLLPVRSMTQFSRYKILRQHLLLPAVPPSADDDSQPRRTWLYLR